MSPELRDTIFRVGLPLLSIFLVLFVCHKRKWPLRKTLALRLPTWKQVGIWTPVFLVLFLGGEYYYATLNLAEGIAWGDKYTVGTIALRVLGMVILAPLSEELIFRGLLFKRISDTRLGSVGAIVLTALLFTALHTQYGAATLILVLLDGLFFGLVRHSSKSLLLPLAFHGLGNLYAVIERITGDGLFY